MKIQMNEESSAVISYESPMCEGVIVNFAISLGNDNASPSQFTVEMIQPDCGQDFIVETDGPGTLRVTILGGWELAHWGDALRWLADQMNARSTVI